MYPRENNIYQIERFAKELTEETFADCTILIELPMTYNDGTKGTIRESVNYPFYETYLKFIEFKIALQLEKAKALKYADEQRNVRLTQLAQQNDNDF